MVSELGNDGAAKAGPPSILVIDDDVELCALVRDYLEGRGFLVEAIHTGRRGLARALSGGHDLILLDVMLPGVDGIEVLHQVRRRSLVPIIMLTARAEDDDRVAGLDGGADDYLPKPFSPRELVARIQSVLRRSTGASAPRPEVVDVRGVRLDASTRMLTCKGRRVETTTIEFDIIEMLMRSAGRIVSREELIAVLHHRPASPFDRSLDVHVSHLRKKLGRRGELIRTVRGVGYFFCAEPDAEPGA